MAVMYSISLVVLRRVTCNQIIMFKRLHENKKKLRIIWMSWCTCCGLCCFIGVINAAGKKMCNALTKSRIQDIITTANQSGKIVNRLLYRVVLSFRITYLHV